ncbi:DNA repair and recombination protein RadB [Candidatus Woesearchaeota archaeon]|nr:DNA repair and recombination protein RadB [Candidatus Woesearchaeota archaeon]
MDGEKISTGSQILDNFLEGGYENDAITTLYGPSGSGKTNLAVIAAVSVASKGKKVIYIDTEGGFSVTRLKQMTKDYKKILGNILFLQPTTFEEQKKDFEKLKDIVNDKIGLIIIDTIAMLYRLVRVQDVQEVNRELGIQIGYLTEIARKKKIPVLVTNQVYTSFELRDKVNMVGGDLLKYGSKCLIELQAGHTGKRRAILRKHRSIAGEKETWFRITNKGLTSLTENN